MEIDRKQQTGKMASLMRRGMDGGQRERKRTGRAQKEKGNECEL